MANGAKKKQELSVEQMKANAQVVGGAKERRMHFPPCQKKRIRRQISIQSSFYRGVRKKLTASVKSNLSKLGVKVQGLGVQICFIYKDHFTLLIGYHYISLCFTCTLYILFTSEGFVKLRNLNKYVYKLRETGKERLSIYFLMSCLNGLGFKSWQMLRT